MYKIDGPPDVPNTTSAGTIAAESEGLSPSLTNYSIQVPKALWEDVRPNLRIS
jgi:hypothetical protein